MISASRRRRPGVISADDAFRLHLRMARRSTWSTRLMRASLLTLAASVVALLAGADLTTHLIACAAAFGAGLALPVPGSERAALAEIRSAAGLSYETALTLVGGRGATREVDGQRDSGALLDDDPYGFQAAVIDRARLSISDIRPASPPAWWLPALAVAITLLLFGVLERPFASGGGSTGGATGPDGGGVNAPIDAGEDLEEVEQPEVAPPEPEAGRAEEPDGADANRPGEGPESPEVAPPAEGSDSAAPMSRFLDSLRERPPEQGGASDEQEAARAEEPSQDPGDQGAGQTSGEREGEPERAEVQEGGTPSGEQSEGEAQGEPGDGEGEAAGEAGDPDAAEGEEGLEPGEEGAQEQAGGGEEQPQAGDGEAPAGQRGDELDQGESEFEGAGADGDESDPADAGGAGAGGGNEQEAGVAEGEGATPDFLEGVLEEGPENPAGTVRLPGDDRVTLPPGRSASDYQSAAEDALTEGDLPLSYQEIIRRYFQ